VTPANPEAAGADGPARLFFALWPEISVRNELAAWQRKLQAGGNARVMRPWTLHLTLAFLGATPFEQFDAVKDAAAGARGKAIDLLLDKAGYWPHNHIVWAGTSAPPPTLLELQATLTARLAAAGVAFDAQAFNPHVTLLRNVRNPKAEWAQAEVIWSARDFVLIESKPGKDGSRYETVAKFPLK
jgi:RNA 2',3'-cyclic 3'-phosphodiesterase